MRSANRLVIALMASALLSTACGARLSDEQRTEALSQFGGGGGGTSRPSRFSSTNSPRLTGEVRFGLEVDSSTLAWVSSPARRPSAGNCTLRNSSISAFGATA